MFSAIFDLIDDTLLVVALDKEKGLKNIESLNLAASRMLGYTKQDLNQLQFKDICQNAVELKKIFTGEPFKFEALFLTKQKKEIRCEVRGKLFEKQDHFFLLLLMKNLAEKKQTEQQLLDLELKFKTLQESEKRLTLALDVGNAGGWEWNLKTNQVAFDPRFHTLLGFVPGELPESVEEWLSQYHHPDDLFSLRLRAESYLRGETSIFESEHRIRRKNGEWNWVFTRGQIVSYTPEGEPLLFVGIALNTTERKKAEELLQQQNREIEAQYEEYMQLNEVLRQTNHDLEIAKMKAEESDRLKSAFLANMSHEIRTPMNGILGFSELLKEPNLTGEEQQQYIQIIEKAGARMLDIINAIVDISKIESGQMEIRLSDTNINEQLEYIYTFFRPEIESKGIQFVVKPGLISQESVIRSDKEKIYAILTNLVKNAIKYSQRGTIEFGYNKIGNQLEFFVKDTGIGIPEGREKIIFDRFVQADISDKKAYQGAGLGLSIAKAYVEMLGGKIWVQSKEGKGTTFFFVLPCYTETKENKVSHSTPVLKKEDYQVRRKKILIAEDDEASDLLISLMLKKAGHEVLHAANGMEAIELCRKNPDLDFILMDIKMPEIDGYEATSRIRQFNKSVIIIAQTAHALVGDREKAIAMGCNDQISKPISNDRLMTLLSKYSKTNQ